MKKINVLTLCSGYDSQFLACRRLMEKYPGAVEFDLVGWAEIDRHAIRSHNLIFPEFADRNFGDISTADWTPLKDKVDLLTYSTPCQSISTAGKQEGITEGSGTESALLWEVKRAIRELRPKYLLQENVKALVSKKFMPEFAKWQQFLRDEGYANWYSVLNAKDYGVPQNRERVFMVSVRIDPGEPAPFYEFPEPFPLERRLKHVLEPEVDESYYLRPEQVQRIVEHCDRKVAEGCGFKTNFQGPDGISGAIKTKEGGREYDTYISEPSIAALRGRDPNNPSSRKPSNGNYEQMLELGPEGLSNTLSTVGKDNLLIEPRIEIVGNVDPVREGGGGLSTTHEAGCIPTKASLVHSLPLTTKSQKLLCSPPKKKV